MDDSETTAIDVEQQTLLAERKICDGNVVLFQRKNSQRWQARIKLRDGKWETYSTKQKDFESAQKSAEERWRDIKYRQETGKIAVTRKFSDVATVSKRELLEEYERTGRDVLLDYAQVVDKYLIPLLGKYHCHNISQDTLRNYSKERREIFGRNPAASTVATHNTAINYVLKKAKELGYVEFVPKTINDGEDKGKRRSYFTDTELRKLNNFMWRHLEKSGKLLEKGGRNGIDTISAKTYDIRVLLRDYVLILVNSGMRPGRESLELKWNNLSVVKQDGMESIKFSLPHTKTKQQRVVIGYEPALRNEDDTRYGCWTPLRRIKERFDNLRNLDWTQLFNVNEYIFRYPDDSRANQEQLTKAFKRLLKACPNEGKDDGLLKDDFGNERVLYSLRHTYASRRRYEGMSFDDLSVQMGTSVKMLEEHYSHFSVSDNPNLFAGHVKREQQKKDKENADAAESIKEMAKQLNEQSAQMAELMEQNRKLVELLAKNQK